MTFRVNFLELVVIGGFQIPMCTTRTMDIRPIFGKLTRTPGQGPKRGRVRGKPGHVLLAKSSEIDISSQDDLILKSLKVHCFCRDQ